MPGREPSPSSSAAMGGGAREILLCPCQAEDLPLENLPIRGLAVPMDECKSIIIKKEDPRVSVAEAAMKEDHLPRTGG